MQTLIEALTKGQEGTCRESLCRLQRGVLNITRGSLCDFQTEVIDLKPGHQLFLNRDLMFRTIM